MTPGTRPVATHCPCGPLAACRTRRRLEFLDGGHGSNPEVLGCNKNDRFPGPARPTSRGVDTAARGLIAPQGREIQGNAAHGAAAIGPDPGQRLRAVRHGLRRASKAAIRALSSSFSSRARRAISLTASNSSRVTTSISRIKRSAWVAEQGLDLAPHPLRGAGGVVHQPRHLVKEPVGGLNHWLVSGNAARVCRQCNMAPARRAARCHAAAGHLPFPAFQPGADLGWPVCHSLVRARLYFRHPVWLALCARAHPQRSRCGPDAAAQGRRLRRLHRLGNARHRAGRTHRLCPVLQLRRISPPIRSRFWRSGRAACHFTAGSWAACSPSFCLRYSRGISILSLGDITCAVGPIGLFLGRIANFVNGELWGRPTDVPWAMVFPSGGPLPRHPSQLYEAALEGIVLFTSARRRDSDGGTEASRVDHWPVCDVVCTDAVVLRIVSRARCPARVPLEQRADHGNAAVRAAVPRPGRRLRRWRCASRDIHERARQKHRSQSRCAA